jgi:anti-sigma factor RsiW
MDCETIRDELSDYVDGTLAADRVNVIDAHLSTCDACTALVRDLDRIRTAAGQLGPIEPPGHLWLEIAGRIQLEAAAPVRRAAAPATRHPMWQWVGLAAALVVITLGVYAIQRMATPAAPTVAGTDGNPAAPATVETVQDELAQAAAHYEKAIAALEAITKNNDGTMDPAIAAAVQKNLATIDQAIADGRAAVQTNPDSEAARDSLFEAFRRKVGVLQATVALMNEMRKGDQGGAARVAAGLGRKS